MKKEKVEKRQHSTRHNGLSVISHNESETLTAFIDLEEEMGEKVHLL
jgi:hypothetical protein